jgi:hypothetical protein
MVGLVTELGLANVIAAWTAYASRPLYLQFGTGSGQTETSTDLAAPVQAREAGMTSQETLILAGDTFRLTGGIIADEPRSITEVGAFDAVSGGNMALYGDFEAIDLDTGDGIVFAISVTVSSV